jgi:hypothetical protein
MDELLNPDKRPVAVKVTSADCDLTSDIPGLEAHLARTLRG